METAERRMFTKKVTDDDKFMTLSASAQALYLHLSMAADDDGFCNQVSVSMFKAHASVQDLKALLEARYVYQFDTGVIVVKHWRMANALRKDRYTPTIFQEELAKLRIKDDGSYLTEEEQEELAESGAGLGMGSLVASWLPDGCQTVASWLPQDSIDKDSIGNNKLSLSKDNDCRTDTVQRVVDEWNTLSAFGIKPVSKITATSNRYKYIKARISEYGIDAVMEAIDNIRHSKFLQGKAGKKPFLIDLEWFARPNNFPKVLEGKYADVETASVIDSESDDEWGDPQ